MFLQLVEEGFAQAGRIEEKAPLADSCLLRGRTWPCRQLTGSRALRDRLVVCEKEMRRDRRSACSRTSLNDLPPIGIPSRLSQACKLRPSSMSRLFVRASDCRYEGQPCTAAVRDTNPFKVTTRHIPAPWLHNERYSLSLNLPVLVIGKPFVVSAQPPRSDSARIAEFMNG